MKSKYSGFTLIELIVVIVILGILAATALPRFIDFKADAANAAVQGVAGAVSSAAAINYGKYQITPGSAERLNTLTSCTKLVTSTVTGLTGGASALTDAHVTITVDADCATGAPASGTTKTCTLQSTDDTTKTAVANVICTA